MNNEELVEIGQQTVTKGRGGKGNFPNSRQGLIQTEEDAMLIKKFLNETLDAYKQPKVKSDEELANRLDEYFAKCAERGSIPLVEEMALYIGYTVNGMNDIESGRRKGFSPDTAVIIKKAKSFMHSFDGKLAVSGKMNFLAYCFRAKNYYGMTDKQEVVVTPNRPLGDDKDTAAIEQEYIESTVTDFTTDD